MMDETADAISLTVTVAEGLCAHLRTRTCEDFGREGYLPHDFISDFENAFALLWRMKLAQAASPREDLWDIDYRARAVFEHFPTCFRLVPQERIAPIVRARGALAPELIEELVSSYICVICDYGGLDHGRSWFVPQGGYLRAMGEFARHGYAEQEADRFRWTDKAIPAMQMAGLWTEMGRPRREVEDEEILAFFEQLPSRGQVELMLIANEPHAALTFAALLSRKYLIDDWRSHFPVGGPFAMSIGTRMHALLAAWVASGKPN